MALYLPPDSATQLAVNEGWTLADHLLAVQADHLAILAWQRTRDGERGRNKPVPIPRPGQKRGRFGTARMSIDEARAHAARRIARE